MYWENRPPPFAPHFQHVNTRGRVVLDPRLPDPVLPERVAGWQASRGVGRPWGPSAPGGTASAIALIGASSRCTAVGTECQHSDFVAGL